MNKYKELQIQLEKLKRLNTSLNNDSDYFSFLFNELEDANLVPGEQDDLESKLKLYKNSEQIKS